MIDLVIVTIFHRVKHKLTGCGVQLGEQGHLYPVSAKVVLDGAYTASLRKNGDDVCLNIVLRQSSSITNGEIIRGFNSKLANVLEWITRHREAVELQAEDLNDIS